MAVSQWNFSKGYGTISLHIYSHKSLIDYM